MGSARKTGSSSGSTSVRDALLSWGCLEIGIRKEEQQLKWSLGVWQPKRIFSFLLHSRGRSGFSFPTESFTGFKWTSSIFVVVCSCWTEQDVCKITDFGCTEKLELLLCFQTPPHHRGSTHNLRALQLLKGETMKPEADFFFCHHSLANDHPQVPYSGASIRALLWSGWESLSVSLSSCHHWSLWEDLRRSPWSWRASAWQWPSIELFLVDLKSSEPD